MNKIIEFFKKLFRKNEPKMLAAPREIDITKSYDAFLESLKVPDKMQLKRAPVTTLICDGDGLGISKRLKY